MSAKNMNISNHSITPNVTDTKLYDRYQFVTESPEVAIPLIIILLLEGLLGTFGNAVILIALYMIKDLKKMDSIFIANMAISDMYVAIVIDTMSIVGRFLCVFVRSSSDLCARRSNHCATRAYF
jgi:hypothetical protein